MKTPKKTDIAIRLMSQAYVLDRMGVAGADPKALAALLREAAKSLDAKVGAIRV